MTKFGGAGKARRKNSEELAWSDGKIQTSLDGRMAKIQRSWDGQNEKIQTC